VGKHKAQDVADPVDAPRLVIVEVKVPSDRFRERIAAITGNGRRRAIVALALGLAVTAAVVVTELDGRSVRPHAAPRVVNARARARGPAGVAAAYGYPLPCLSVTILAGDRSYARADFNHRLPCGRFTGWPTAIFHYVTGAWRPVLDAVQFLCPVKDLPEAVQTELNVCP
jgi:hypothetical protein